jgi:hypothetical protein
LWANRTELASTVASEVGSAIGIVAGPDGGAAVLGSVPSGSNINVAVISSGSDGVTAWNTIVRSIPSGYSYPDHAALTVLPGGGYVVAAGEGSYNGAHSGIHARLTCVDAAGGGVTDAFNWPEPPPFGGNIYCYTLQTGGDGSVWAIDKEPSQVVVKRFGSAPLAPGPPAVVTVGFDSLQTTSVRLKGTVNPNGASTSYYYEFGPTAAYGSITPTRSVPGVTAAVDAFEPGVGVAAGASYHFRLVATNASGTVQSADQTFTVPQSGYQVWTVNAFGSLNAPGSGPSDDPDSDGLANLTEYAFGGNATVTGSPSGLPVFSLWESPDSGITFPSIVYRSDPSRTDVTLTPVASNDLAAWSNTGIVVINLPDGSRRAVAQGFQHFMRLQISAP